MGSMKAGGGQTVSVYLTPLKGKHTGGQCMHAHKACRPRQQLAGCGRVLVAGGARTARTAQQAYQKAFMTSKMEPSAAVGGVTSLMLSLST